MKLVSAVSLGIALSLGTAAIVSTTPAFAAKKEKAPAAPSYNLGKAFRAAVGPVQALIKGGKLEEAKAAMTTAEASAVTPDEKYVGAQIRLELALALKDTAMQSAALNTMLASGSTPAADVPKLSFFAGNFAYERGDYVTAVTRMTEADRLGYKSTDMLLRLAEANFKQNKISEGLTFVERAIGDSNAAGTAAPATWYARATSVAYKAKMWNEVGKWTRLQVRAYPTAENWRNALVIYRDSAKVEGQLALDLFRLMRATKSLAGERDFFEYASTATERALPGEAKSTIEEGFASGAVSKTSRAVNEMLTLATGKIASDRSSLLSSEKSAANGTGKTASGTADGFLGYGEDAKAIPLYKLALTKGGADTDAVNTRLGIAYARTGQKDLARSAFSLVKGPRAEIAAFWMLWLDTQA